MNLLIQNYFCENSVEMREISEIYECGIQTVAPLSSSGPGTGVPFHWHGPGYSEVIYGRKVGGNQLPN